MKKTIPNIDARPVCLRLKELRLKLGFPNKSKFAKHLGVLPQTYQNYETDRMPPSELIYNLTEKFKRSVDIHWLMTGERSPNEEREPTQNVFPEPQTKENLGENQNSLSIAERRKTPQNQREGIISNFNDSEIARQTILYMAEIEKLDRDHYMMLAGEIKGTARAMRPKKRA